MKIFVSGISYYRNDIQVQFSVDEGEKPVHTYYERVPYTRNARGHREVAMDAAKQLVERFEKFNNLLSDLVESGEIEIPGEI